VAAIESFLPKLSSHPILIGWGGRDFCFNDRFFHQWKQRFPGASCQYYPDAGHFVLENAATDLIPEIKAFLKG
jgi:haloalkane dehalogenase